MRPAHTHCSCCGKHIREIHRWCRGYELQWVCPACAAEDLETKVLYPVLCSWCQREGLRTVVRYSETENSHSICARHKAAVGREIDEARGGATVARRVHNPEAEGSTPSPATNNSDARAVGMSGAGPHEKETLKRETSRRGARVAHPALGVAAVVTA